MSEMQENHEVTAILWCLKNLFKCLKEKNESTLGISGNVFHIGSASSIIIRIGGDIDTWQQFKKTTSVYLILLW
jgi:hypothetical protein